MIDGLWLALRAAGLVLALQAAGVGLFLSGCRAQLTPFAAVLRPHVRRVAAMALVTCLLQVGSEVTHMAGEWSGLTDPALLRLLTVSSAGIALLVRLGAVAMLLAGLGRDTPAGRRLAVAGSVAVVGSFALTGHTSTNAARLLLAPLLVVHVAVAAFWFGALWPLQRASALAPGVAAAQLAAAFSRAAIRLVPLLPLAGLGMALLLLPDLQALDSPYGRLLCLKVLLFALLMLLAGLNRLRFAPAMARGVAASFVAFRRSVLLEWWLIVLTLAVTALLTGLYSPGHGAHHLAQLTAPA